MAINPALVTTGTTELFPAPFPGESILLKRTKMSLDLNGLRSNPSKWSSRGTLYLTNIRMVFVADARDPSGLHAFDFPLSYLRNDVLNQPIFFCNNLSGEVWPAEEGGGPSGTLPPYDFKLYFKEGGIGTFYPLYYAMVDAAKKAAAQRMHFQATRESEQYVRDVASKAYIDPNDPTTVYLTEPVHESQRLSECPKYAANYNADEKYEPM